MDLAFQAQMERVKQNDKSASDLFRHALDFEIKAIMELKGQEIQPTYSVLHRSAAQLALDCQEYKLARFLAAKGLGSDKIHEEIAEELSDVIIAAIDNIQNKKEESIDGQIRVW